MRRVGTALWQARGALVGAPTRAASGTASARWSNLMRAQSKSTTPDDPPTAPLPECHEIEGQADFSNYIDKYSDTSLTQAITGLGFMLGVCYGLYVAATARSRSTPPLFTLREHPNTSADLPTAERYHIVTDVEKVAE
jgi:hypothetical protein